MAIAVVEESAAMVGKASWRVEGAHSPSPR